ncbi:hypothetical protein [uncultured Mediterranean phage uvDeep-CGR2-KM21-C88]|nr:hypothetical protein [uncultured Mediterranean phage uvDeep-CGR2-KM21-C88]
MPLTDLEHILPFSFEYDIDGTVWVQAYSHGALVKNTPYQILVGTSGYKTAALASGTDNYIVGVCPTTIAAASTQVRMQIGGLVEAMITGSITGTINRSLKIASGAVTAGPSGDFDGNPDDFCVVVETATGTTQKVILIPKYITES